MTDLRTEHDHSALEAEFEMTPGEFAARYHLVYARLVLVATSMTHDGAIAEDIVQDAAAIAFQKLKQFRPGTDFAAWLTEIVRRCSLNFVRKRKGRGTFATDPRNLDVPDKPRIADNILDDDGNLRRDQAAFDDRVVAALEQLDEVPRTCLLLRVVGQLSFRELATQLQIPEGTAMSHVHRSKLAIRKFLQDDSGEDDSGDTLTEDR